MTSDSGRCAVCDVSGAKQCAGCQQVSYCGKDHQRQHWKAGHREQCRCFKVSRNSILGRHLTATRPITRGELIFTDSPLLVGPKMSSAPVCLGCHRNLQTQLLHRLKEDAFEVDYYHCRGCGWPMCGPICETFPNHRDECPVLARSSSTIRSRIYFNPVDPNRRESAYCVVVPLRALLLKRSNPQRFREGFLSLESHLETRIRTPLYAALRSNLVPFVRSVLGMGDQVSEQDLLQIAAVLDTNCYDVRLPERDVKVRALYELGAMMSHHCRPNTKHYFDERLRLVVVATVDIPKDAVISISYTQPLLATIQRRYAIQQAKCFECCCDRCRDPTELATYAGSIVCPACRKAKVVPFDPLDLRSQWQCESRKCSFRESALDAVRRNEQLQATIMALGRANSPRDEYERFLARHQQSSSGGVELHPWNTNVLQVKYALTQLYGRGVGTMMDQEADHHQPLQPEAHLRRQVELCRDLLEVADRLEPGFSPFRGKLLVGLRDALVMLRDRKLADLTLWPAATVAPLDANSNAGHVHPAAAAVGMTTTSRQRRQRGRINSEITSNCRGGRTMAQLLEEVEKELAEMRKSDPTFEKPPVKSSCPSATRTGVVDEQSLGKDVEGQVENFKARDEIK